MDPTLLLDMSLISSLSANAISSFFSSLTTNLDPSQVSTVVLPSVFEYAALITGAVSGALIASEHNLDIIGATALAMVTGLGGGLLRDIILPTSSIYMLDHPIAIITCLLIGILAFFFHSVFKRMNTLAVFMWVDILSVAFFAAAGADKALSMDYNALSCVFIGLITAVGGGMLRDICLGEVPTIFRRGTYYAVAALAGTAVYVIVCELHFIKTVALIACTVVTVVLRVVSVKYNIQTISDVDLSSKLTKPLRNAWAGMLVARRDRARNSRYHKLVIDDTNQVPTAGATTAYQMFGSSTLSNEDSLPGAAGAADSAGTAGTAGAAGATGASGSPAPGQAEAERARRASGAANSAASGNASSGDTNNPDDIGRGESHKHYMRKPGVPLQPIDADRKDSQ
jgi:uncharacterized membrane protein YeiH